LITGREVAQLTGLSLRTIRERKAGTAELARVKIGRSWWYSAESVDQWIDARLREAEKRNVVVPFRRKA